MFFSRIKISTKLIISSAVFLIPIGVMLFFICFNTVGIIQKSIDAYDGIVTIKPAVTAMQSIPEYMNAYLGLEQKNRAPVDPRILDEQISSALRTLDRGLDRYRTAGNSLPVFFNAWNTLKNSDRDDEDFFTNFIDFTYSLRYAINTIGEGSKLILVSDINTYYFVASAINHIPEAVMRILTLGNLVRDNMYHAESIIERYNNDIAEQQGTGRRMQSRPYEGSPADMPLSMFASSDNQQIRNIQLFMVSDRERIRNSLISAAESGRRRSSGLGEIETRLDRYSEAVDALSGINSRGFGFNAANPSTGSEFSAAVSNLNDELCLLWSQSFELLSVQIQRNIRVARWQLIVYLSIVLISLGIAIGFVIFITLDINKSVKSLNTLFRGLNENDLTLTLQINSKDEFGDLMKAFNGFLNILRSTFGSFRHSTQLVADSVFDLSSSSKEITTTANEQSASVSEIVSTMEGSKNLSEQIALKTTEVANLARETQELSTKGADLREANQTMMEDIRSQNQKIISEIRNLTDMIVRISEAIRIIDSIADQTKLIAFNASLEASSSGEAGARFSVVASEIRRFADNVVESTREIKQKIEEVQGASQTLIAEANSGSRQIEIGYERMSEQKIVFEHIVDNSQNVATRSQQISNLSKQQELASSQIFSALKEISAGVKQFVIATSSTSKIADSLNGMSEELKDKVEKYRVEA